MSIIDRYPNSKLLNNHSNGSIMKYTELFLILTCLIFFLREHVVKESLTGTASGSNKPRNRRKTFLTVAINCSEWKNRTKSKSSVSFILLTRYISVTLIYHRNSSRFAEYSIFNIHLPFTVMLTINSTLPNKFSAVQV